MQPDLFTTNEPVAHPLQDGSLIEYPRLFSDHESATLFDQLSACIAWSQADIRIAGKTIPIPRLQCWIAEPDLDYAYSGINMSPCPWPAQVLAIKKRIEEISGFSFNSVLANYYRDGQDSVAWHADDEPELGKNPTVASISFGAVRPFDLKHKHRPELDKVRLRLTAGSLLVMGGITQTNWLHQLPKVKGLREPRINLTFRRIMG